jgi:hypothetical protein
VKKRKQIGPIERRRFLKQVLWAGIGAFVGRVFFSLRREREPVGSGGSADREGYREGAELAG